MHIADVLDEDLPTLWREEDVLAAAENRRRAAEKAALARRAKARCLKSDPADTAETCISSNLKDWEEFDRFGFLK